jgi:hypothetical protein
MPMPLRSMESRATGSVPRRRRSSASCAAKGVPSKLRSMRAVKQPSISSSSNTASSERSRVRPTSKPATMRPSGARTLVGSS